MYLNPKVMNKKGQFLLGDEDEEEKEEGEGEEW
jgi:hypothetical protein